MVLQKAHLVDFVPILHFWKIEFPAKPFHEISLIFRILPVSVRHHFELEPLPPMLTKHIHYSRAGWVVVGVCEEACAMVRMERTEVDRIPFWEGAIA